MNPEDDQNSTGETAEDAASFEEKFQKLQEIIDEMEREELPLEELLDKFEEGVKHLRECSEFLDEARTRVEQYVEMTEEGPRLKDISDDALDEGSEPDDA